MYFGNNIIRSATILKIANNKTQITNKSQLPKSEIPNNYQLSIHFRAHQKFWSLGIGI
jgi:hypothetical protein